MKLCIDARNGLAGDIMVAGLMGLGADADAIISAMESAGEPLGGARISKVADGNVHRLRVEVPDRPDHLHAEEAMEFLGSALLASGIGEPWSGLGFRTLKALAEAEAHVHAHHPALKGHFHGRGAVLHEASDIIIDITGMAAAMQFLDVRQAEYMGPVNVGSGQVTFSHGTLEVPTPATRRILEIHGIPWRNSDSGMEMTTPTGAAMLAGCGAVGVGSLPNDCRRASAGGTRPLPPVNFMLCGPGQNP